MKELTVYFRNGKTAVWKKGEYHHWDWYCNSKTLKIYDKIGQGHRSITDRLLAVYNIDSLIGVEERDVEE